VSAARQNGAEITNIERRQDDETAPDHERSGWAQYSKRPPNNSSDTSLIHSAAGLGGIEEFDALATAQGRPLAEDVQARRADKRLCGAACRDAMVDWLSSQDAWTPLTQPARDQMLAHPRYGTRQCRGDLIGRHQARRPEADAAVRAGVGTGCRPHRCPRPPTALREFAPSGKTS
jgi:hypothetical protein